LTDFNHSEDSTMSSSAAATLDVAASDAVPETAEPLPAAIETSARYEQGRHRIKNHTIGAMTAGVIPLPVFDLAAVTAIQIHMLKKLTDDYEIPFSKELVRSLVASLLGGSVSTAAGMGVASGIKGLPLIGTAAGSLGASTMAGLITYAVGMTFLRHFETGGDLLSFKPDQMRNYFQEEIEKGREVVKKYRAKKPMSKAEQSEAIESLTKNVGDISEKMERMMTAMKINDSTAGH
jgi:uncharacterized protein (DUF697 family)